MSNNLKRITIAIKISFQCFVAIFEFVGIPFVLALLSTFVMRITGDNYLWQWIERTVFCFAVYEVLVIIIRKMQIDARNDAILTLKTAFDFALLFCESGDQEIYKYTLSKINEATKPENLNQMDVLQEYNNLQKLMKEKQIIEIKKKIIILQHNIESNNLAWNYTFILRLFK